jgi:hypothetical protein
MNTTALLHTWQRQQWDRLTHQERQRIMSEAQRRNITVWEFMVVYWDGNK